MQIVCIDIIYKINCILHFCFNAFKTAVVGIPPKMFWTECPINDACDKCLSVAFEKETDIACLKQKWPENPCTYEGFFIMEPDSRVAVSSQQCVINGKLDDIQVVDITIGQTAL